MQRHWSAEGTSKWGHRTVAILEAIPVLGGLVALVEIAVMKYCFSSSPSSGVKAPELSSPVFHLEFNVPTTLTLSQTLKLRILRDTFESELPEYKDSLFETIPVDNRHYLVTRRRKEEAPLLGGKPAELPSLQGPVQSQNLHGILDEEGLKVRTFCLELLSHFEDAIKRAPPDRTAQLKECKHVVRYFIQNGALEKQAGFSDFVRLIDLLRIQVPETASLLKRFLDLAQLQKYLPERKKPSRWNKIKLAIELGLFKGLDQISERIEAIGLRSIPAIPSQQRIVNLYPMMDAINLVESHHREAGRWLMARVRVFTFRELCQSIQQSCHQLRDLVLSWDRYCLLTIKGKSQEWMASLAVHYLPKEKMPDQVLSMHHHGAGEDLFQHLMESSFDHFILFDDGAYSGRQVNGYLFDLRMKLRFACQSEPRLHDRFERKKTIYLVFGFFPKDLDLQKEVSSHNLEEYNVHVEVLTNCRIESCSTLMENEELPEPLRDQIRDLAGSDTKPLIATEWKKPDFMSTPMFVTQGWAGGWSRAKHGELRNSFSTSLSMHTEGPFTDVVPPYRNTAF